MTTRRDALFARIRAHPVLFGSTGVVLVAGLVFVLVWFQPQALLFDRVVDEQFPAVDAAAQPPPPPAEDPDGDAPPAADEAGEADDADLPGSDDVEADTDEVVEEDGPQVAIEPVALASGSFSSRNRYTVQGTATVYELEDGSRVLRLEDFESTNGPDLFVYLTAADEADEDADLDADYVDLGVLRGNIGNQNYDIPDDVDLDRYDTAVIWCLRFTVGFGAADLEPAG